MRVRLHLVVQGRGGRGRRFGVDGGDRVRLVSHVEVEIPRADDAVTSSRVPASSQRLRLSSSRGWRERTGPSCRCRRRAR